MMAISSRLARLAAMSALLATSALADSFSFVGDFTHDNDVQFFSFTLLSGTNVVLRTLGYGGGVSASSQVVTAGGFESVLQVYAANTGIAQGGPIQPGPDPTCSFRTPDPQRNNFCQDAYFGGFLSAGSYILALTQSPNDPLGNLSDGFFYRDVVPDANFNSGFIGSGPFQGTSHWAVDLLFVDAASEQTSTPEPGAAFLAATALAVMGMRSRRRRLI